DLCYARGAIPFVDYGTSSIKLTDVISGVHDSAITAWATSYKNWGKPVFSRLWWEMNQYGSGWFSWAVPKYYSAAQYVAAWQHVVNLCNAAGATNMTWVWCPNFIGTDSSRVAQLQDCYPGDAYVDWTSFDGYNSYSPSQTFDALYQLTYNSILDVAPSKPMVIGEFASRDTSIFASGVKGSWITEALSNKIPNDYPAIKAILWFNWKIYESSIWKDWPIESSSSAQSAFAAAIASDYYQTKLASVPPFGKVPIPA
ncbi:MAG TPA: glycosyl hydrolase, partial [Allocoleopsis sp.]